MFRYSASLTERLARRRSILRCGGLRVLRGFLCHFSSLLSSLFSLSPFTHFSESACDVVALCHRLLSLTRTIRRLLLLTDVLPSLPYFLGITPTLHHLLQPPRSPRQLPLSTILQSVIDRGTYTIDLIRNSSLDLYTTSSST